MLEGGTWQGGGVVGVKFSDFFWQIETLLVFYIASQYAYCNRNMHIAIESILRLA